MLRKEHDFLDITGVPSIWVPDNLKSAVTKACRYDPVINAAYYAMASIMTLR
jgi:hypothetical protein